MELNVGGVDKKYELQYIIEYRGRSVQSGHYVSYFKINDDIWYEANDLHISIIATQDLSRQPYILGCDDFELLSWIFFGISESASVTES